MAKRKKKSQGLLHYLGKAIVYAVKGIGYGLFYAGKGLFIATRFTAKQTAKQTSKASNTIKEKKIEAKRPKTNAKYESLTEIKPLKGKLSKFESNLLAKDSLIGIILGARGSGKSAIGMKLLENFKTNTSKNIYAMGFKKEDLPNWISVIEGIESIQNNSVVLVDEGGITFSSRNSMSDANKVLSELLFIARHKNLTILFITQNSSNLEVNVIRQADFLMMKPSSLLQKDFERKKIKDIYENVTNHFEEFKENPGITYIHSDKFQGFASNTLPSFWNTNVSKAFK